MAVVNSSKFNFTEIADWIRTQYIPDLVEVTSEVIPEVAKDAAKKLKQESPKGTGKTKGKYARGWTSKGEKGRYKVMATVYGKHGTYQLAHLLEYGHANRNGGRTQGIEHIAPVEEWAMNEAYERIMDRLEHTP